MRKTAKFPAEPTTKNFLNRCQLCFACNQYELIFSTFKSTHSNFILLLNNVIKRETFNLLLSKKKSQCQASGSQSHLSLMRCFSTGKSMMCLRGLQAVWILFSRKSRFYSRLFLIVVLFSWEIITSVINFYTDLTKFQQCNYASYLQIF